MMAPARTAVPSNTFTPRRCALESRPLRVDPPPLVFDMLTLVLAPADAGDLDRCVLLTMAPRSAAPALVLIGEAADLGALGLAHHSRGNDRADQVGSTGQDGIPVDH